MPPRRLLPRTVRAGIISYSDAIAPSAVVPSEGAAGGGSGAYNENEYFYAMSDESGDDDIDEVN